MEIGSDVESWLASVRKEKMDVYNAISFYRLNLLTDFFNRCMNSVASNYFVRLKLLVWKICSQSGPRTQNFALSVNWS